MENKLELNIIWKTDDILKIDKQLEEKDIVTFFFDEINSSINIKSFKSNDVKKRAFTHLKWGVIGILALFTALYLLALMNVGQVIGSVLLISIFFLILGIISIPFTSYTEISLKKQNLKKRSVNKIYKKNLIGITNILLDLDMDYPEKINRIVFKQCVDKIYITFRLEKGDVIPIGSPIFVVDFNNEFQLNGIEEILVDFISNGSHEIKIEKIYSNPK